MRENSPVPIAKKNPASEKVINLNLYKIKKSLMEEGFEVEEGKDGRLKLIIRL